MILKLGYDKLKHRNSRNYTGYSSRNVYGIFPILKYFNYFSHSNILCLISLQSGTRVFRTYGTGMDIGMSYQTTL
jgi:hypothetical protein